MPLQNRVDPFGEIHAVQARGLFTGNRGVIHDPATKTLLKRRWTTRAWIVCVCAFKGRRRAVMGRNAPSGGAGWTELFFLDEVTALAAGHRPCFYCRRAAARDFMDRFATAAGLRAPKVADLDGRLHAERRATGAQGRSISGEAARSLPDGAMVAQDDAAYAIRDGKALAWRFDGYEAASLPAAVTVLTPRTTLNVLAAGYRPVWHESA
ncbi:hypothetical protein [Nitratireductor pacificus]|uniref:Uncharacterized protein n=1 Tax=Nitratireductor pacificus pht-3B TaxID=391937 RepID=K2MIZ7_9HYPH|nr:hypothetical protein [Nitratireductor pacificus]EKF20660.1 hypothetical protein NA2_02709 [Nitratireductor pacificus pht-3B]